MLPLLGLVLFASVALAYIYRRSDKTQSEAEENFWAREQKANTTVKRDISDLPYITISLDKFPLDFVKDEKASELLSEVNELSSKKLLNLNDKTNTDLKLAYGLNNLEEMQNIGENFVRLTIIIKELAEILIQYEEIDAAITLLEYGVALGTDISSNYTMLGDCYMKKGQPRRVERLLEQVKLMRLFMEPSIISHLSSLLEPSFHADSEVDPSLETSQNE